MKQIIFVLILFSCFSAVGQTTGTVVVKTRLIDAETKTRSLTVDRGTELEIIKDKEKGYYTVSYEGNKYLMFHENINIHNQSNIHVGKIKIPSDFAKLNEFDQTKINQSFLFTNYCLSKFRKEQLTGFGLGLVGGGLAVVGSINESNELAIIGGIVSLSGLVIHLSSYRWLKRAYFYPLENGAAVGLKIKF